MTRMALTNGKMKAVSKNRYVKVTALDKDTEWYAVGNSRREAKAIADEMGMPSDNREYVDIYLTQDQYEAIPEW
jgi:hypothetical protein